MKISRTLRFALWSSLRGFPTASAVIVLEEDLLLSADFYSYMTQLEPLFSRDRTLYCVNAFNHLSYPHTGSDPSLVYRVRTYPAYGWMMPRKILEEILPKWLPVDLVFEWDYFLGSELVRGDRECVVPDINRSFHWGTGGLHIKASYAAEVLYLSRSLNDNPPAPLRLDRILKENYEAEFLQLLKHALPVVFSSKEDLDTHARKGVVLSVFVSKEHERDESSFRIFASEMGIWTGDDRDHHNFAWRLTYAEATVLVIGVPISPYSSFMPKGYPLLRGSTQTDQEVFLGEFYLRASTRVQTHQNGSHLPPWGHVRPRKREPRTRQ